jgi:UDP-N-acetylglucosamine 1-carboxyvinyltransferase
MKLGIRRLQIALSGEAVVREVVRKIAEWLAKQADQDGGPRFTGTWSDLCNEVMEPETSSPASVPSTPGLDGDPSEASRNSRPHLPPFRQTAIHLNLPNEIVIDGGRPLVGTIEVQGSRNALPKQLIAALLTRKKCVLHNVPNLTDMLIVAEMIWQLGGTVHRDGRSIVVSTAKICADNMSRLSAFHETTRVSILLLAPLLHRFKRAFIPKQGGCDLGKRDVKFHLASLEKMGATIEDQSDGVVACAPNGLEGRVIDLDYPSVGATEQILLAGALAHGDTKISNAAIDPEVIDLANCLQDMGCQVSWNHQREITITGKRLDDMGGYDFLPMHDRSEIASWACAALASDGSVTIKNVVRKDLEGFLQEYEGVGGGLEVLSDGIRFFRKSDLTATNIETGSHPRFRTDWQPPFVAMLTQASGNSYVHETVFEERLRYVLKLRDGMGANIDTFDTCFPTICRFAKKYIHSARVCGPTKLSPADLHIPELRGGFAYLMAALVAHGRSRIRNLRFLQKGYDDIVSKLARLEANVTSL